MGSDWKGWHWQGCCSGKNWNTAEEKLFDIIGTAAWDDRQKAALIIAFYDYVNSKDDAFLAAANFSRDEIISGLEDALKMINMEIPEYLQIR